MTLIPEQLEAIRRLDTCTVVIALCRSREFSLEKLRAAVASTA